MRFRQLGLALAPLILTAGAAGTSLQLNGQPLPGPPLTDSWVPLDRLWPLGVPSGSDAETVASLFGSKLPLRWSGGMPAVALASLPSLGISVQRQGAQVLLSKPMAALETLKVDADGETSRIVWRTDRACLWRWREDDRKLIVEMGGTGGSWPTAAAGAGVIQGVKVTTPTPGVVRLEIDRRYPTPVEFDADGQAFSLTLPNHFVLDDESRLVSGLTYRRHYEATEAGPLTWHVLTIPKTTNHQVKVLAAAKDGRFAKAPVSRLAAEAGATVAINAGYFSATSPVGLLMQRGNVLTSPLYNRTLLALPDKGTPFITRTQLSLEVLAGDGQSAEIDWVNFGRQRNSLAAYTERFGARSGTKPDGLTWEVAIDAEGRVIADGTCDLTIPPGGVVLAGQGPVATWLKRHLTPGALAAVRSKLDQLWPDVREAIAGGPTLVRDGEVVVTAAEEKFQPDITQGRAPRTAVGLTPAGDTIWLVADGRDPGHSRGLSLTETAQLLRSLGANQAMNLDGGGSSTLVINGKVVNRPSDGRERPVSTALGLVPAAASAVPRRSGSSR